MMISRSKWHRLESPGNGDTAMYGRQDSLAADGVDAGTVWHVAEPWLWDAAGRGGGLSGTQLGGEW